MDTLLYLHADDVALSNDDDGDARAFDDAADQSVHSDDLADDVGHLHYGDDSMHWWAYCVHCEASENCETVHDALRVFVEENS